MVRLGRHRDPVVGRLPLGEYETTWWAPGSPTKAGSAFHARAERRLTEDAEAGVHPATLTRRKAASLSGGGGHSNRIDVRVDDETYEAIRRLANEGQGSMSDVVVKPFAGPSMRADRPGA
ncbi:MAG: hypothetical protein QOI54_1156 [Actinomycetota bacterium]|jgi:DNA-binding transcriptional LysR family regulator|nr:hypothetical protein [Actinomycetota bacterium]